MAEERDPKSGNTPGQGKSGKSGKQNQGTNQPRQSEQTGRGTEEDSNTSGRRNPSESMEDDTE